MPNIARDFENPKGVPIDAIIFGGRTSDREPLIRAITDLAEGVYDGLTLGAEATFAAEGVDGQLRYDPMSMRPFMSYPEGAYAAHWLKIIGAAADHADLRARQLVPAGPGGRALPLARLPGEPAAAAVAHQLRNGEVQGVPTPVGIVPTKAELDLDGVDISAGRPGPDPVHRHRAGGSRR